MDAILLAGGIPLPEEPLYPYTNGDSKALLEIAGKPMVQWVLDALSNTKHVDNVIIIGLSAKSEITCNKSLHFISNQGRMLSNVVAGVTKSVELDPKSEYVLVISADIPGINGEMVDWLIESCDDIKEDMFFSVISREVMEARYPGSKRTYTKLKDVDLCGADMHIAHVSMAMDPDHLAMWEELIGNRKSPLKQAATIGFGTLIKVATRSITLDDLVTTVTKRIGITGRAILWEQAEPGMDVDKPHQYELVSEDMEKLHNKT